MMSVVEEQIREGRLTLAAMLAGHKDVPGETFDRKNGVLFLRDRTGKVIARVGVRRAFTKLPEAKLSVEANDPFAELAGELPAEDIPTETVSIAMDAPNFIDFQRVTPLHKDLFERNADAILLSWCDPKSLLVPIIQSEDIYAHVHITCVIPEDYPAVNVSNFSSDIREFHIKTPGQWEDQLMSDGPSSNMHSIGTLEFPFSILMIRSLVISWWQAHRDNHGRFHQECYTCHKNLAHFQGFADRWSVSFTGKCNGCEIIEADLSTAIPKW